MLTQPAKSKRRRYRETTISASVSSAAAAANINSQSPSDSSATYLTNPSQNHNQNQKFDTHTVVSPDSSWCSPPPRQNQELVSVFTIDPSQSLSPSPSLPPPLLPSDSPSNLKIQNSPTTIGPVMDFIPSTTSSNGAVLYGTMNSFATQDDYPSSLNKFNSALTAGLLNPMSPPPSVDKTRSSPTLFEMMANEPGCHPRAAHIPTKNLTLLAQNPPIPQLDKQSLTQQRLQGLLACRSPGNQFNDSSSSDVKLTLSSKDGLNVSINVHKQILVAHSPFLAVKLSDRLPKQRNSNRSIVEIADCDDIEVYVETLRLMYCKDLKKKLMKEDVSMVLGILKVSASIAFDAGVLSCLEYLEAAPWAEDEEEKVASLLSELHLEGVGGNEVLKRISIDVAAGVEDGSENEGVALKLLQAVLEGKDEKARREMKGLVSKMLHENSYQNELRKESLYSACDGCLQLLHHRFLRAAEGNLQDVGQIARQADNLHWMLDILIDRQIAEDFLKTWASQFDLADAHPKVPAIHRYEVSMVTARLFVGIGKGQLLASKDARYLLLQTWLVPFYEDFGWMRRASKGLDRHLIEDGLSNTILTLPLSWQQKVLMSWFDRFLNSGEDCPNIQRGFEVWWRRAFWRRNGEPERPLQL